MAFVWRRIPVLIVWNMALTAATVALGISWMRPDARFTEISVERVNVRDHNGIQRLVIANRERFPEVVIDGKRGKRSDRKIAPAGIVVYDERGNEAGGLATAAMPGATGEDAAGSVLMFDYGRSEAVGFWQRHTASGGQAALVIADPAPPGDTAGSGPQRITAGTADRAATLAIHDSRGRPRIRLSVDASDRPSISILDENGVVSQRIPATP